MIRSLGSLVMNGPQFGTVVTMPISGFLSKSDIGWPSVFYIFGVIAIAWSVLFYCLGADRPSEHPRISPKEVYYINSSLGNLDKAGQTEVRLFFSPDHTFLFLYTLSNRRGRKM